MTRRPLPANAKLMLDFAPLGVFFIAYRMGGMMAATAALVVATGVALAISYAVERKLALAPLITGIVVLVFGGLTLLLDDELFIKLKPTIVNLIFATVLLVGAYGFKCGLLKYILDVAFQMTPEGWMKLSIRWGVFFVFLAVLNECIWRHFSTEFWVNFKVFGMFTLTIAFALAQVPLVNRCGIKNS